MALDNGKVFSFKLESNREIPKLWGKSSQYLVSLLIIKAFNYNINIVTLLAYAMQQCVTYQTQIYTVYGTGLQYNYTVI